MIIESRFPRDGFCWYIWFSFSAKDMKRLHVKLWLIPLLKLYYCLNHERWILNTRSIYLSVYKYKVYIEVFKSLQQPKLSGSISGFACTKQRTPSGSWMMNPLYAPPPSSDGVKKKTCCQGSALRLSLILPPYNIYLFMYGRCDFSMQ